jgi:hypothetical protein
MDPSQKKDEEHFRQVERALLFVDDAARKVSRIADDLRSDDADPELVTAIQAAGDALRADHRQLMKSVYFRPPGSGSQQDLLAS